MQSQAAIEGMPSTLQTWRSPQCRTSSRTTRWMAAMPPTSWPSESVSSASEQVASSSNICSDRTSPRAQNQVKVYKDSGVVFRHGPLRRLWCHLPREGEEGSRLRLLGGDQGGGRNQER